MKHKSGEPPFYDVKAMSERPCSVLTLLLVTIVFVSVLTSFGRYSFFGMLPLAAYPIYLTSLAGMSAKRLFRKLLPLSLFVIFIGAWNVFSDKSVITLFGVTIGAGWLSLAAIALKFLLTAGAVLAMFALTGFDAICRVFASLSFPQFLTDQFFLFYRHIALISAETRNIIRARLFRGGRISVSQSGNICGPLILRSAARSRRIHSALACRGYTDVIFTEKRTRTRVGFSDRIFGVVWIAFFFAVRFDLASAIGDMVLRYKVY